MVTGIATVLVPTLAAFLCPDSAITPQDEPSFGTQASVRIFAATGSFGGGGKLVAIQGRAPWHTTTVATLDSPDAVIHTFGRKLYVIEPETDRVRVFGATGAELQSFSVGKGTRPRDILVVSQYTAYITRANATHLYRIDPQTGVGREVVDLSIFADDDGIPEMERMATDGTRLFVQLRRLGGIGQSDGDWNNGAIAVIDLETETLIDADPKTPALDAIELLGPAPRLRMHVDTARGYLLVSATDGNYLNFNGGIEYVNLVTLSSEGFVLQEIDIAALGGFVITGDEAGYFLFHTDIVASNHLRRFTVPGGQEPGNEIVFDAGTYLDALLYDPATKLLYMPASAGGVYIVDTNTDEQVTPEPIPLPGLPVNLVLGPPGTLHSTGNEPP